MHATTRRRRAGSLVTGCASLLERATMGKLVGIVGPSNIQHVKAKGTKVSHLIMVIRGVGESDGAVLSCRLVMTVLGLSVLAWFGLACLGLALYTRLV